MCDVTLLQFLFFFNYFLKDPFFYRIFFLFNCTYFTYITYKLPRISYKYKTISLFQQIISQKFDISQGGKLLMVGNKIISVVSLNKNQ